VTLKPEPQPTTLTTTGWADYALLDSGGGRKLERYGRFTVVRPEPQCLWSPRLAASAWDKADAAFDPGKDKDGDEDDAGNWRFAHKPPESWPLSWGPAKFHARFTNFRHLAFFPEQAANWAWMQARARIRSEKARPLRVLNLFGYTGVASLVLAAAGAQVTHVDASKKAVAWGKENATLSGIDDIRWIVEDARKWLQREDRRGSKYDAIVLDPPKYGRGPTGEVWRLFEDLPELVGLASGLLSDEADFLLVNAYAARISGLSLSHLLAETLEGRTGRIDWGELALAEDGEDGRALGLSFFARWSAA
jgi:23S rRNA (cytosine1962-C5)-methyltransferase